MSITASQVKELRELSGAGMMDCKAALAENQGDIKAAMDWLRKKGIAKADKKAGRTAAEGLVGSLTKGNKAVLIEVNSETDFVARNDNFQKLVQDILEVAIANNGDIEAISQASYPQSQKSVSEAITEATAVIGENLHFRRSTMLSVGEGIVTSYMHNSVADGMGKLGVLVAIETTAQGPAIENFGRQIAMHIAAANPLALNEAQIDAQIIEHEKAIFSDQARQSGKPENIIAKMVEGRMRKFFEEVVLLSQAFVIKPEISIKEAIKEAEQEIGAAIKITGFARFALGEGVEKKESDFAAEVAATVKS